MAGLWARAGIEITMRTSYAPGLPEVTRRDGYQVVRRGGRYAVFGRAAMAEALERIGFRTTTAEGYGFQIEMTYRLLRRGGKVVEVPIRFTDRVRGSSKMSWRIVFEAMALVTWWGFRDRVLRRRGRALGPRPPGQ